MGIVTGSRGVTGTVALATGLDPDEGILEGVASVGGRAHTEASADDIAPITPGLLLGGLDTVSGWMMESVNVKSRVIRSQLTGIHDEMGWKAGRL